MMPRFKSEKADSTGVGLAAGAADALGPAEPDKQFPALFVGGEHRVYVN